MKTSTTSKLGITLAGTSTSAVAAVLLLALTSVCAADSYRIYAIGNGQVGTPSVGTFFVQAPGPIGLQSTVMTEPGTNASAPANARADAGIVGAGVSGFFDTPGGLTLSFSPIALGSAAGFVIFSGPTPTVAASMNIHLEGSLFHPLSSGLTSGASFVGLDIGFGADLQYNARVQQGNPSVTRNDFGLSTTFGTSSLSVDGEAQTPTFIFPTGVPIPVSFELMVSVSQQSNGIPAHQIWSDDFASTASFSQTGPAFNLPNGYTANGFGVVNNQFVPEPSSAALLLVGGVSLLRRHRAR